MYIHTFILINFIVSFIADIVLNDLSTNYNIITELKSYFKNKSIIEAGIYAGLTVISALIISIIISKYLYNFYIPINNNQLIKFNIIAFIFGYIYDILIHKLNIFDGLDEYYKTYGSGLWGALAFIVSINISFIIQKYILPYL